MARVLIPVMNRRYNANPRGSATTTVVMSANNPFERPVNVLNATRSMLPGMGALGADPAPAAAPGSIDWNAILTGGVTAAAQLAAAKLNPPIKVATGISPIPVVGPGYYPPKPSMAPWLIGGGVAVLGVVGLFLMLRK